MSEDIVERLREWDGCCSFCANELYGHAASEIERLRREVDVLKKALSARSAEQRRNTKYPFTPRGQGG